MRGMARTYQLICWKRQVGGQTEETGRPTPPMSVERPEYFPIGRVHRATPQCICLYAAVCQTRQLPAAK